jgi:arylsulfatase
MTFSNSPRCFNGRRARFPLITVGRGEFTGVIGRTFDTSSPAWPEPLRAKEGAPNVQHAHHRAVLADQVVHPAGRNHHSNARHKEIPAWDDMLADLKPVLARQMEIYAGFLEQVDHHIGRLVDTLEDLGILDDTLIYLIIGDNGGSAEGTINGCFNEMTTLNGMPGIETTEFLLSKIDDFGTPKAYNHYAVGWAHALCAPYQWTKQVASHWGGTRNGTIVHWPKGVRGKGEMRTQFHHVIDVAKTILDVAGLPEPAIVNSIAQAPFEGSA